MLKNITLSGDEALIRKARDKARRQHTSLNAVFRQWLERYVGQEDAGTNYVALMERLSYARPGRHFTRDELNER